VSAGRVRALAALRARPGAAASAGLGVFLASLMLGAAATTGYALATGFGRAQQAARTADVVARFDPVAPSTVLDRVRTLPNVASARVRLIERPVELALIRGSVPERWRFGTAEVDALQSGPPAADGLAVIAGRGLSGAPDEALVERGLASAWGVKVGDEIGMRLHRDGRRRFFFGHVVGITLEPDDVAYPLASRPRVYLGEIAADRLLGRGAHDAASAVYLRVRDRSQLAVTLAEARTVSFGLHGLTFTTRSSVRALVGQVAGLVIALLTSFGLIALAAAAALLAASSHARVTRELATIGALRALGFGPAALARSYALEAAIVALPCAAAGVCLGAWLVSGPTAGVLTRLNELPPPHVLGWPQLAAVALATVASSAAAAIPAGLAARRPVVSSLAGAATVGARRGAVRGSLPLLGARFALARPGRLAVAAGALAASLATVLLLLALARFLLAAERDPAILGERYALLVDGGEEIVPTVRSTPGVAAAAERDEAHGVAAFDLGEPVTLVAFGEGRARVFAGRRLLDGRRAHGPGEAEVGLGLAERLGLAPGSPLVVELSDGSEVRARVAGVVQELASDGRVAYLDDAALAGAGGVTRQVAVRVTAGARPADVQRRLEQEGLHVAVNGGLAPSGGTLLHAVVALLRIVAVIDSLVCVALVLLALIVLARERRGAIAVLRSAGARPGQVVGLLAGAAAAHLVLALPLAYALERLVLAPALSGLVARYGDLPLAPAALDVALVALGGALAAATTAWLAARQLTREPVAAGLGG
jgi:hypothetical protein